MAVLISLVLLVVVVVVVGDACAWGRFGLLVGAAWVGAMGGGGRRRRGI